MTDAESTGVPSRAAKHAVLALRGLAMALVVTGFVGWAVEDDTAFALESPYTLAFGVGVACAIASIYLGVFLANSPDTGD